MKESDVRERVQAFLRNTVRFVVVPASMGIGLALIGCGSSDETPQDDNTGVAGLAGQSGEGGAGGSSQGSVSWGSSSSSSVGGSSVSGGSDGVGGMATLYSAPVFDAGAGGSAGSLASTPVYSASWPMGGTMGTKYSSPMPKGGSSIQKSSLTGGNGGLSSIYYTYGTPWAGSSGTGGRGGNGGITTTPPGSSGGVTTGAPPDGGPGFDGGNSDLRTGGTTTPVTRYGGIFPTSSTTRGS